MNSIFYPEEDVSFIAYRDFLFEKKNISFLNDLSSKTEVGVGWRSRSH